MHMNRIVLCSSLLSEFMRPAKCFCSVLTLCWLHREVLHCCCQLPQHFCGFNGPLFRHSASFEVRWVSQDLKNTQDTFLLSFFTKMWCRYSPAGSSGVSLARRTGAWLGREPHLWSVVSPHDYTWPRAQRLCPSLLPMWINCLGVSGLSLILLCLNIVTGTALKMSDTLTPAVLLQGKWLGWEEDKICTAVICGNSVKAHLKSQWKDINTHTDAHRHK